MRIDRRDGYRVVVGGPVPPQAAAITLGKTIIVRPDCADSDHLMAHELVHVRQYTELGRARFLVRYVRSYLRLRLSGYGHMASYRRIPLEVEASWLSRLHERSALEPDTRATRSDGVADGPEGVSRARAPRLASMQRLHDRAEALGLVTPERRRREAEHALAETAALQDASGAGRGESAFPGAG